MTIKIEDIIFWIMLLAVIGIIIWKLFGSPTDIAAIITIASLIIGAEISLWKRIYCTERKAEVDFIKVKKDLEIIKIKIDSRFNDMDNRFSDINKKLNDLENLIKKKK